MEIVSRNLSWSHLSTRTKSFTFSLIALAMIFSYFSSSSLTRTPSTNNTTPSPSSPFSSSATLAYRLLTFSSSSYGSLSSTSSTFSTTINTNLFKLVENLTSCNIFEGKWVLFDDDSVSAYYQPGSCPFLDDSFNCVKNGRPDSGFMRWRWRPHDCSIPRLDGKQMLEMLRGKRVVFVGDSLNRNMWESLVCILRNSLVDKTLVYDTSGSSQMSDFRSQGYYSFTFQDYNCSLEFVRAPFLVQEWKISVPAGDRKETLRLDLMHKSAVVYQNADLIVFNTGHWWTHEKTSKGKNYYQEGDFVYDKLDVTEAYTKALRTWARWVDDHIDPSRTRVFFRGYSISHYRGGRWNSGGNCDGETQPITNDTYLAPYPKMMVILESVIREMKTPVYYLNVTRMSDYRKDGHPSIYQPRSAAVAAPAGAGAGHGGSVYQDCSHWCLPGVPDAWNELLYAAILLSHQVSR